MKPCFDLFVIHKTAEGELEAMAFKLGSEDLPPTLYWTISDITERILNEVREKGLDPVRVVFLPYTYMFAHDEYGNSVINFVADTFRLKCVWAAEGYSLDDVHIPALLYTLEFDGQDGQKNNLI